MKKLTALSLYSKRLFIMTSLLVSLTLCSQRIPCNKMPESFTSYQQAIEMVESASFSFVDHTNTSKSSWIRGADYYSCDRESGFMIMRTEDKKYIFKGVPVEIWKGFKNAGSHGEYYNRYIRNQYPCPLDL